MVPYYWGAINRTNFDFKISQQPTNKKLGNFLLEPA